MNNNDPQVGDAIITTQEVTMYASLGVVVIPIYTVLHVKEVTPRGIVSKEDFEMRIPTSASGHWNKAYLLYAFPYIIDHGLYTVISESDYVLYGMINGFVPPPREG